MNSRNDIHRRAFLRTIPALTSATVGGVFAQQSAPPARLKLDLRIPKERPYLALTPAEIARAKERARRFSWAKSVTDRIVAEADRRVAVGWHELPPKGTFPGHTRLGSQLFGAALAYSLTGEKKYAEWTRDGLLAYAAIYPSLPLSNLRFKIQDSSLNEAVLIVILAQAYDMVAASGVFNQEQARRVEQDLLRASTVCFRIMDFQNDPRVKDLHYRCYNYQIWHLAATGLVGLALHDTGLVEYAINSPYGLRHLIAHDINDDGMFWERSIHYHQWTMAGILPLTEAMMRCGVDLYALEAPTDRTTVEDQHYMTDTSDRPKSLRLLWDAPFYLCFPDLSYPALGDSDCGPLRGGWDQLVGYQRYRDPKLAWLNAKAMAVEGWPLRDRDFEQPQRAVAALIYDLPDSPPSGLPIKDGTFANTGEYRNGCSLLPSTGVAVLRQAAGDFTRQPDSTAVSLSYGPYGGGHGHPDKLGIVVYSQGRQWIPAFGSMPYRTEWKADWTSQTVSHNTLTVDGISQRPVGAKSVQWADDTASDQVLGKLERFDPRAWLASASCDRLYDGFQLKRTVRLDRHCVIDDYVAAPTSASGSHRFDYVLHIDGQLESSSTPLAPRSGKLGDKSGYQHVEQKQGVTASGVVGFTFASGGKQLRIWIIPTDDTPTEAILADGLTNKNPTPAAGESNPNCCLNISRGITMPMLVLRRRAARARFLTVIEPVDPNHAIRAVSLERDANGDPAALVLDSTGQRRVSLR